MFWYISQDLPIILLSNDLNYEITIWYQVPCANFVLFCFNWYGAAGGVQTIAWNYNPNYEGDSKWNKWIYSASE